MLRTYPTGASTICSDEIKALRLSGYISKNRRVPTRKSWPEYRGTVPTNGSSRPSRSCEKPSCSTASSYLKVCYSSVNLGILVFSRGALRSGVIWLQVSIAVRGQTTIVWNACYNSSSVKIKTVKGPDLSLTPAPGFLWRCVAYWDRLNYTPL